MSVYLNECNHCFFLLIKFFGGLWTRRLLRFRQGDTILRQDNEGCGMYIVVTGMVESKYKEIMPGFNNVWCAPYTSVTEPF
jgi:hypothetical protein